MNANIVGKMSNSSSLWDKWRLRIYQRRFERHSFAKSPWNQLIQRGIYNREPTWSGSSVEIEHRAKTCSQVKTVDRYVVHCVQQVSQSTRTISRLRVLFEREKSQHTRFCLALLLTTLEFFGDFMQTRKL